MDTQELEEKYRRTLDFLYGIPMFQVVGERAFIPKLDNIRTLCARLGDPQERFRSIHVAGTNGKGSTSHLLASALMEAGYKVGLYTSPHLVDFRERIRINGEMIGREEVVAFTERMRETIDTIHSSFFEVTTAMAFEAFARRGVDVAVIETGLGGRIDSTNIVTPLLSVITNISFDHKNILGNTLAEIAGEKAGIVKPGVPVVIGEHGAESDPVFLREAQRIGAPITFAEDRFRVESYTAEAAVLVGPNGLRETYVPALLGACQQKNLATFRTAVEALPLPLPEKAVREGVRNVVRNTRLMGRWQPLAETPFTVCDTGHNVGGWQWLSPQLKASAERYGQLVMVIGFVGDKDISGILALMPRNARYIFTRPSVERGLDERALAAKAKEAGLEGETSPSVGEAYARAKELAKAGDMIFIGGSSYVVADLLALRQ